jgi:hypothetical protein
MNILINDDWNPVVVPVEDKAIYTDFFIILSADD